MLNESNKLVTRETAITLLSQIGNYNMTSDVMLRKKFSGFLTVAFKEMQRLVLVAKSSK